MQARLRLRRKADFARVREHGKSWRHPWVILSAAAHDAAAGTPGHNRYGVVVSRRVGKAVERNRVRRLLRESLRCHHRRIRPGYDIVLIARAAMVGKRFAEVNQAVQALLGQAALLAPDDERDVEVPE